MSKGLASLKRPTVNRMIFSEFLCSPNNSKDDKTLNQLSQMSILKLLMFLKLCFYKLCVHAYVEGKS